MNEPETIKDWLDVKDIIAKETFIFEPIIRKRGFYVMSEKSFNQYCSGAVHNGFTYHSEEAQMMFRIFMNRRDIMCKRIMNEVGVFMMFTLNDK
jgi:hypothetical protein